MPDIDDLIKQFLSAVGGTSDHDRRVSYAKTIAALMEAKYWKERAYNEYREHNRRVDVLMAEKEKARR